MISWFGSAAASGNRGDPFFNNVELLLHMDGSDGSTTFTDNSNNGFVPTVVGTAQIDTSQSKFGGAAGLFDGNSDLIYYNSDPAWDLAGSAFTLECWVRFNALPSGSSDFVSRWGNNGNRSYVFQYNDVTGAMRFAWSSDGFVQTNVEASWSPSTNTWYHIAACRDDSGDLRLFLDGTQIGTTTSVGTINNNGKIFTVAALEDGGGYGSFLNGWLDDIRVTVGTARYTANFTPPSAAFPNE